MKTFVMGLLSTPDVKKGMDYITLFLKKNTIKSRQGIYVGKDAFDIVAEIVNMFPEKRMSVSGYIDNVVRQHLESHKDEINRLYRDELQRLKNKNLIE
jgi:hypothetical protein